MASLASRFKEFIPDAIRGAVTAGATPNIASGGPTDIFRAMSAAAGGIEQRQDTLHERQRKAAEDAFNQAMDQAEAERQIKNAEADSAYRKAQLENARERSETSRGQLEQARIRNEADIRRNDEKAKAATATAEKALLDARATAEDRELNTPAGRLEQWRKLQQANPDVDLPVNVPYIYTGKYEAPKEEGTISNAYELAMEAAGGDAGLAVPIVKEIYGRDKPAKGELDDAAQTEASEILVGAEGDYDKAIEHAKLTGKGAALKVLLDWRVLDKRGDPSARSGQMSTPEIQALLSGGGASAQGPPPTMNAGANLGVPGGVPGMGAPGVPYNIPRLPNPDPLDFYGQ